MAFNISILDFAHIKCSNQILFEGGDGEKRREIGCFSWLLSNGEVHVLVDTGVADIDVINTTVRSGGRWEKRQALEDGLMSAGVSADNIGTVILTHEHYDHVSNLPKCKNAHIYIHMKALAAIYDEANPHYKQLVEVRNFLSDKKEAGLVTEVADCLSLGEDIQIQHVGGHTAGSQIVFAKTDKGNCLMTGDAVFVLDNISNDIPIGLTQSKEQSRSVLKICSDFDGKVLPSHDLEILRYFKGGKEDV